MSLGNLTLTDVMPEQETTFPGMAYFAGSGKLPRPAAIASTGTRNPARSRDAASPTGG